MKHLFNVVTGKNYRMNQLDEVVFDLPLGRFKRWPRSSDVFLQKCAFAVIMQVRTGLRYLLFDNQHLPEYRDLSNHPHDQRVVDLAAFIGWYYAYRAFSFLVSGLAEDDEIRRGLVSDLPELARTMYPPTQAVEKAVEDMKRLETGKIDTDRINMRWAEIIDGVAGFKLENPTLMIQLEGRVRAGRVHDLGDVRGNVGVSKGRRCAQNGLMTRLAPMR